MGKQTSFQEIKNCSKASLVNTDIEGVIESVYMNRLSVLSELNLEKM